MPQRVSREELNFRKEQKGPKLKTEAMCKQESKVMST